MELANTTQTLDVKSILLDFKDHLGNYLISIKNEIETKKQNKEKFWHYRFFVFRNFDIAANQKCALELINFVDKYILHEYISFKIDDDNVLAANKLNFLENFVVDMMYILKRYSGTDFINYDIGILYPDKLTKNIYEFLAKFKNYLQPILQNEITKKHLTWAGFINNNLKIYSLQYLINSNMPGVHDLLKYITLLRKEINIQIKNYAVDTQNLYA